MPNLRIISVEHRIRSIVIWDSMRHRWSHRLMYSQYRLHFVRCSLAIHVTFITLDFYSLQFGIYNDTSLLRQ